MDVIFITIEVFAAICMIAIISALFSFMVMRDMQYRKIESRAAIELVRSKVIGKREEPLKSAAANLLGFTYFTIFEVRGEQVEMQILSEVQYRELRIGQKGLLQYKRKNGNLLFIHFDSD